MKKVQLLGQGEAIGVIEQSSSERERKEASTSPFLLRGPIRTVTRSDARP